MVRVILEVRKTNDNEGVFIVHSREDCDGISYSSSNSVHSESDYDCSLTLSDAKKSTLVKEKTTHNSVGAKVHGREEDTVPTLSSSVDVSSQENFTERRDDEIFSPQKRSTEEKEDEEERDLNTPSRDLNTPSRDQEDSNKKIKRLSVSTISTFSTSTVEKAHKSHHMNDRDNLSHTIERLSRPTMAYLSYLSQRPVGENSKVRVEEKRVQNTGNFTNHAKSLLKKPTCVFPNIAQRSSRTKVNELLHLQEINVLKSESSFQKHVHARERNDSESNRSSVFDRLYTSNKILKAEQPRVVGSSSVNRKPSRPRTKPNENIVHNVHSRLYDNSKRYQDEGKKLRNDIAERIRCKREMKVSTEKISLERACRLYYRGMESKRARDALRQKSKFER